jgi:hypothetical protein
MANGMHGLLHTMRLTTYGVCRLIKKIIGPVSVRLQVCPGLCTPLLPSFRIQGIHESSPETQTTNQ